MNVIARRLWDREMTVRKWSELNGFKYSYVQHVLAGRRGAWNAGTAKKIKEALINQGLATKKEINWA